MKPVWQIFEISDANLTWGTCRSCGRYGRSFSPQKKKDLRKFPKSENAENEEKADTKTRKMHRYRCRFLFFGIFILRITVLFADLHYRYHYCCLFISGNVLLVTAKYSRNVLCNECDWNGNLTLAASPQHLQT